MTSESEVLLTRFFHLPSAHDKDVVAPYFIVMDDDVQPHAIKELLELGRTTARIP